ncbi:hypothetical protein N9J26_01395 [bacterium]|nr:hypothetical protein [bacterium]
MKLQNLVLGCTALVAVLSITFNVIFWLDQSIDVKPIVEYVPSELATQNVNDKPASLPPAANTLDKSKVIQQLLKNKNYRGLSDHLARVGVPEQMVKAMVLAGIEADYQSNNAREPGVYWKPEVADPLIMSNDLLVQNADKRDQLLAIYGDSIKDDPEFYPLFRPLQQKLAFLSSEKQIQLQELQLMAVSNTGFGNTEYDQLMQDILGAEDYHEYQLRESPTAKQLQNELAAFEYTEQDYRELYSIKQASSQNSGLSGAYLSLNDTIGEARDPAEADIKNYFGEERYEQYQRSKQPDFRRTLSIADGQYVAREDAIAVYQIVQETRQTMNQYYQNPSAVDAQKTDQVNQALLDANKKITNIVGETIADKFVNGVLSPAGLR